MRRWPCLVVLSDGTELRKRIRAWSLDHLDLLIRIDFPSVRGWAIIPEEEIASEE
jgi:hypothetical protein